jgi:hypothetical protein
MFVFALMMIWSFGFCLLWGEVASPRVCILDLFIGSPCLSILTAMQYGRLVPIVLDEIAQMQLHYILLAPTNTK